MSVSQVGSSSSPATSCAGLMVYSMLLPSRLSNKIPVKVTICYPHTVCVIYLAVALIFGGLANHVNIAKLNVRHLIGSKHGFLSIQCSKSPNKSLTNCIFRTNCQIFESPIIPRIQYVTYYNGLSYCYCRTV